MQLALKDLTSHGVLYKDRFLSRGENVLTFDLFKYGGPPDDKLARPYDAFLRVRMASIIYVHTHRFYSEVLSFFNQFHQLQGQNSIWKYFMLELKLRISFSTILH